MRFIMENNVLIFGHKNPDTDSITSALVMENLERCMGILTQKQLEQVM